MKVLRKREVEVKKARIGDQITIQLAEFGEFTATAQKITDRGPLFMFDDYVASRPMNAKSTNKGGYATEKEIPSMKWNDVSTKLSELDTSKLHYVKVPKNHIVIDFDIPDEEGNKCFDGIHLHYIYTGDVSKLRG